VKKLVFYATVVLLMPYLTVLVVEHSVGGGMATFVALLAAGLCVLLSAAFAQLAALATALLRVARKLLGGKRSLEAPPSLGEKLFFGGGSFAVALAIYTITGVGLSFWVDGGTGTFIVMMVGLGALYGALMAYGFLSNLMDPDDVDALGVQPDPLSESDVRRRTDGAATREEPRDND